MEQRRKTPRHEHQVAVEIRHGSDVHTGESKNLSLGGMFVQTPLALPFGTRVQVKFRVATLEEPIEVSAEVRWRDEDLPGIGLRFDGLRPREVYALNKLLGP